MDEFIKNIKGVYAKLKDDESQDIFANRLLYSLTGNNNYILDIVRKTKEGRHILEVLSNSRQKKVIFGAGIWGKNIVNVYKDISFECFVDSTVKDPINDKLYCGIPLVSFSEFIKNTAGDELIIISSRLYHEHMYKQLTEAGIQEKNIVDIGGVLDSMSHRQYFDLPALKENLSSNEVFIDGGCFDGKTSKQFIEWCGEKFQKIYAFEPDPTNLLKCKQELIDYQGKYELIPRGLWNVNGELRFSAISNGSSKVSEAGNINIKVASLDETVGDRVTFIKLDVEGSEYEALIGGRKIISQNKPKLAISIYHKPEDIWNLPALLLQFNPDYRFYLRHYSIAASETVLYAI